MQLFRMSRGRLFDANRRIESPSEDEHEQRLCEEYLAALEKEIDGAVANIDGVVCPLCQRSYLNAEDAISSCSVCGFQTLGETVKKLQNDLEHHRVNCQCEAQIFCYEDCSSDDATHLAFRCHVCGIMDVFPI